MLAMAGTAFSLPPNLDANLLKMDPPQHSCIRRLVAQAFTTRRVEGLRPHVEALAVELPDQLEGGATTEPISKYAAPLSIGVICDLFGVPRADQGLLRARTDALVNGPVCSRNSHCPLRSRVISSLRGYVTGTGTRSSMTAVFCRCKEIPPNRATSGSSTSRQDRSYRR
jgi:cytochrome P450